MKRKKLVLVRYNDDGILHICPEQHIRRSKLQKVSAKYIDGHFYRASILSTGDKDYLQSLLRQLRLPSTVAIETIVTLHDNTYSYSDSHRSLDFADDSAAAHTTEVDDSDVLRSGLRDSSPGTGVEYEIAPLPVNLFHSGWDSSHSSAIPIIQKCDQPNTSAIVADPLPDNMIEPANLINDTTDNLETNLNMFCDILPPSLNCLDGTESNSTPANENSDVDSSLLNILCVECDQPNTSAVVVDLLPDNIIEPANLINDTTDNFETNSAKENLDVDSSLLDILCVENYDPTQYTDSPANAFTIGSRLGKRKRLFCYYCRALQSNLSRHLHIRHMNEPDVSLLFACKKAPVTPYGKTVRRRWSVDEKAAILDFFHTHLQEERLPSYKLCQEAKARHKVLSSRSPTLIKAYVNNEINKRRRLTAKSAM